MKYIHILKTALLISTIAICEIAMSQQINIKKHYIKVKMVGAIASISINGIPFLKNIDTEGLVTTEPVNQWLKNGENSLSYTIYPDTESTSYTPKLSALIFLHDDKEEFPTPLKNLAEISFSPEKDDVYPVRKTVSFKINDTIATKLWDDAVIISEISSQDKNEMIEIATKLSNAVLNDTKLAIDIQLYKIQEDALAEGKTVERLKEVASDSYQWLHSQKDLKADSLQPDNVKFNICGNGYLVNLLRVNDEEAIILESDDMFFDIGLYFAKIKGHWTIVR